MKKAFSYLEILFILIIISFLIFSINFSNTYNSLKDAKDRIVLHLQYARYIAFIDNKEDILDEKWQMRLWSLKFQRCSETVGGLYYSMYSDTNTDTTHFSKSDCLKDPLTNKYLYSNSECKASKDESKYILLTKEYGIDKVDVSCNDTGSIGQIAFANDGNVYTNLKEFTKLDKKCYITLFKGKEKELITIEPNTGYIY